VHAAKQLVRQTLIADNLSQRAAPDYHRCSQSKGEMILARNACVALSFAFLASAQARSQDQPIARLGVRSVQAPLAELEPMATFDLGGDPDWLAISNDAVWVTNDKLKAVQRIDPRTSKVVAKIEFPSEPCSGLAFAFGTLWVPLCGDARSLARIDPATNTIAATLPVGPADSEGGITASEDSIWIISDQNGTLLRIDPSTNSVRAKIAVPPGSFNPLYSEGVVWITGNKSGVLSSLDAKTNEIRPSIPVGPQPRFLTAGAGSIWTLNQGDGSVTRVDAKTRRAVATIEAGIPGPGGELCFGAGSVWATVIDFPLTQISPATNKIVRQYTGPGGDSVRFGHNSLWLTHLRAGQLWRLTLKSVTPNPR
jgi:virginiamycin B lyase